MRRKIYGNVTLQICQDVEIDKSELSGLNDSEVENAFIEKVYKEFGDINNFIVNNTVGTYIDGEVEFDEVGIIED